MSDDVRPGPGWKWLTIGFETSQIHEDDPDPSGPAVVVPSRLRVTRSDDDGRPTMRVDIAVLPTEDGKWMAGVIGLEFFGDESHLINHTYRAALGVDTDVDGFVRQAARVETYGQAKGKSLRAQVEATTYEPIDPRDDVRVALGAVRPAGRVVAQQDRARAVGDEVEMAVRLYREYMHRHEVGESGKPSPLKHVAEVMGLPRRTAARRIERARELGLLPPTTPGKVQL